MNITEIINANKKKLLVGLTIIVVIIFTFIMFKSYKIVKNLENIDELPLIKSDVVDVKIKQETKDAEDDYKSFYETFNRTKQKNNQEINIMEEHNEADSISKNVKVSSSTVPNITKIELNNSDKKNNVNEEINIEKVIDKTENIKEVIINEKKDNKLDNKKNNNIVEEEDDTFYKAQLVALKNRQQATVFVEKTKRRYSDILRGLDVFITEIDLNEKGIFYRVQVGNFNTKNGALVFCSEYKKLSTGGDLTNCIVVK